MHIEDALGEVHREEAVTITGIVRLDLRKTAFVPDAKTRGDLHVGLYGVTVTQPHSGSAILFPWRVVQNVEMDAPQA